ncbi:hypothetical protein [Campylobacter sp. CCUG 57310]|uniref:hypothetical protein n=2 Tax=Campylobacter sp. CCUG 57310 TaxID=2517362 RepID=UPI001562FB9F|nr:hypothetical protein [Campylobacter sp. CCUG 57310]QKF91449.1 hypothetical protein CORI_0213 [Campylobacter sp. CCUG 57310]
MALENLQTIHKIDDLLEKFSEYEKRCNHITFYCSNLNKFYPIKEASELGGSIINRLFNCSKSKSVNIITKYYVDKDEILDSRDGGDNRQEKYIKIKRFFKDSIDVKVLLDGKSPVEEFTRGLIRLADDIKRIEYEKEISNNPHYRSYSYNPPKANIQTYTEATNLLIKHYQEQEANILGLLKKLKDDIVKQAKMIFSKEEFDAEKQAKDNIEEAFNKLTENMKELSEDGIRVVLKEFIKMLIELVDISDFKKTLKKTNLLLNADSVFRFGLNVYSYYSNRGFYAFANPIRSLLAQEFGFMFNLVNTKSLCNIIVFKPDKDSKDGFFIDFTGFDVGSQNEEVNADEYLGVCGYVSGDTDAFDYEKATNVSTAKHNPKIALRANKGEGRQKDSDSMYAMLTNTVASSRLNFVYIQHPFFNSFKFAKLISGKSNISKNDKTNSEKYTGVTKNYLVISNAPFKENAGLSERILTAALQYKITDENNRINKNPKVNKTYTQAPDDMTPVKDYSKYKIEINADNENDAYVLNLSPFIRIEKSYIDELKQDILVGNEALWDIDNSDDVKYNLELIEKGEVSKQNLDYINLFFKQPKDMEEIREKEQKYLDQSIDYFKTFFESINKKDITVFKDYSGKVLYVYEGFFPTDEDPFVQSDFVTNPYSALDVVLLSVTFFMIKQMYGKVGVSRSESVFSGIGINTQADEYISVHERKFKVLNKNAFMEDENSKKRIYFFRDTKSGAKDEDALCIEELADEFEKNLIRDDQVLFDDEFYKLLSELESSYEDDKPKSDLSNEEKDIEDFLDKEYKLNKDRYNQLISDLNNMGKSEKDIIDEAIESITNDILKNLFPFYAYFSDENYKHILRTIAKSIFKRESLKSILIQELGILSIISTYNNISSKINIVATNNPKRIKGISKRIANKSFANILKFKKYTFLYYIDKESKSNYKKLNDAKKIYPDILSKINKEVLKQHIETYKSALMESIVKNGLSSIVDCLITTKFEELKNGYEKLKYEKFTHKHNDPYAVENISLCPLTHKASSNEKSSYLYYPMNIYSSFMSIDLKDMFIGGRLSSGGLDYNSFIYYEMDNSNLKTSNNLSKQLPLNKLLAYLCLDELRTTSDKSDHKYFRHLKGKEFGFMPEELKIAGFNRELNISKLNPIPIEHRNEMYRVYQQGSEDEVDIPIDKYNESMEILNDFSRGIYNTDEETKQDDKARRLLKALNVIGQNNLKGMYVGCKEREKDRIANINTVIKEIPPRLIGRLATTIIMEDGLYIG